MEETTISTLKQWKKNKNKFAVITAYDFSFAKLFYNQGISIMLIGDSLGMTIQGNNSTIPVQVKDIVYHTKAVRKGAPKAFLLSDLPFLSYYNISKAIENTKKIIQAGANMIKIEGGKKILNIVQELSNQSILVCGHIGLTPQSVDFLGGYKIQGKNKDDAMQLIEEALLLEKAGIKMIVLECIPSKLAKKITEKLSIPVIGIGSGKNTDGQILVMQDVLGITEENIPRFSKNFFNKDNSIQKAIQQYIIEVKYGLYPTQKHSF
ncbi:3-methyl-2-oxobutanoate hydroxymethyltransferase [Buchnera aphidicola]|uniref:3-methyl-2-oxobutanoate hydroxymethyltransferase n=1 Tax=Buchnera aphidicola TaxID=9 RepID=UPI003BEF45E6